MADSSGENAFRDPLADGGDSGGMSAVLNVISTRRSVRTGFGPASPPDRVVDCIVAAGLAAPSSKNAQPWRLHVVTSRHVLDEVARLVKDHDEVDTYVPVDPRTGAGNPGFESTVLASAEVLEAVPLAVFVENLGSFGGGRQSLLSASTELLRQALVGFQFELLGIGGAIQNMWLTAVDLGLAGVFMGDVLVAENEICDLLGCTGDLVGVLALGYSETEPPPVAAPDAPERVVRHD